jgi:UDP-N-acetylmuramate--alanine ligase
MQTHPLSIGTLHIIGIGGIGMSSIAEVLHRLGHRVQGSDQADNANTERLRKLGIPVFIGAHADNVINVTTVIRSSAIPSTHAEIVAARKQKIPVLSRAELLAEIMRYKSTISVSGTHGKTTTTSLMATLLLNASLDPTILSGGILVDLHSNARAGQGAWMVVEADESDKTFIQIPTTIGVITNIEPEHMENYGTFEKLKDAFVSFANSVPFYGFSVVCLDHPTIKEILPRFTKPYITYGTSKKADCRASNIKHTPHGMSFDAQFEGYTLTDVQLALHGRHNVLNALAVIAVGLKLGIFPEMIKKTLASFGGVQRRFIKTGEVGGVTIIDDYGHHPTEIAAVLKAAQKVTKGKVIAVVQPHKYSRLHDLFKEFSTCFTDADRLILAPVYGAGEKPLKNISHTTLATEVRKHFKGKVHTIDSEAELPALIQEAARPGDYVIFLGAGNISQWAYNLPQTLQPLLR